MVSPVATVSARRLFASVHQGRGSTFCRPGRVREAVLSVPENCGTRGRDSSGSSSLYSPSVSDDSRAVCP